MSGQNSFHETRFWHNVGANGSSCYNLTMPSNFVHFSLLPDDNRISVKLICKSQLTLTRNTKVKVRSPDGDTDYIDIVAGVLQEDTLTPYLFIICLDYVLRTSIDKIKENGFKQTKERSRRSSSSSSYRAGITDIPDPLSPLLPIVHRPR